MLMRKFTAIMNTTVKSECVVPLWTWLIISVTHSKDRGSPTPIRTATNTMTCARLRTLFTLGEKPYEIMCVHGCEGMQACAHCI